MVQFAPAARLVPQLFAKANEDAFGPLTLMPEMTRVKLPVLVNVTCCDGLVVPTSRSPNDKLVVESEAIGASPVPPSVTLCGDPLALSVIEIAAVSAPDEDGVN
jgi:hypothetical protein